MKIKYGTRLHNVDITQICYTTLLDNGIITIPPDDNVRARLFGDPLHGILKKVFIYTDFIVDGKIHEYDYTTTVSIDIVNNTICSV